MSGERVEAWADALGRELVTTDPAVHAALTAIAGGLDEMRAMAGLVQHLSRVVQVYQARELKEVREQPPRCPGSHKKPVRVCPDCGSEMAVFGEQVVYHEREPKREPPKSEPVGAGAYWRDW